MIRLPVAGVEEWQPLLSNSLGYRRPEPASLVGWRHCVWRVVEIVPTHPANWTDADRTALAGVREAVAEDHKPYVAVLRHVSGPVPAHVVFHRGLLHLRCGASTRIWSQVPERFALCACCLHPSPCKLELQDRLADAEAERLERVMAALEPDTCAGCLQKIRPKQRRVVFEGENLFLPGGGPVLFHLSGGCWLDAQVYEDRRLAADPTVTRLVSCPGTGFVHKVGKVDDCSAGPGCTGLHRPVGRRPCSVRYVTEAGAALGPQWRCAAEGCQGLSDPG